MDKNLPDKWIRKAVFDAFNGTIIDTEIINVYDQRVTNDVNSEAPDFYVLQTTQSNQVNQSVKCGYRWEASLLLDVFTRYEGMGNPGSRLLADNILDSLRNSVKDLELDVLSGLEIVKVDMSFPSDLNSTTKKENIFRKFLRLNLLIN